MQTSNTWCVLSWVAVALMATAAVLEMLDRDYVKAAGTCCMMLLFVLLAIGGSSDKPRWKKVTFGLLILLWSGLFALRFTVNKGG